jgi:predicted secreted protein
MLMSRSLLVLFFLLSTACALSAAEKAPDSNRVSFRVTANAEVDSDLLVVRLFVQHQARQQAQAANQVNKDMSWGLAEIAKHSVVKAQTLDYRTNPVYDKRKITAWQTRQSLRMESADHEALSALLGVLQQRLGVESVAYEVSTAVREAVEKELIHTAIERFRTRAASVTAAFQRSHYNLVNINIGTAGGQPPGVVYSGRAMAMKAEVAAPTLDAGQQTLSVSINGTIELASQ